MIERRPEGVAVADGVVVDAAGLVLPWADPAAQWGLGVFETIAVRAGAARNVSAHLHRLTAAAGSLDVPLPDCAALVSGIDRVATGVATGHGWLKVAGSRSGRWVAFAGASDPAGEGRPVSAMILPWRRHRLDPLAGVKSLAHAGAIRGLEEVLRAGAQEGLWLNERGHVIEACTANVFAVRGRAVVTPAVSDGARPGVTRERAMISLRTLGHQVRESKLRVLALRSADEIFLTSSLAGVRPVVRLDGRDVRGGRVGPVTLRVAEALAEADRQRDPAAIGPDSRG